MKKQEQNELLEVMLSVAFGAIGTGSSGKGQTIEVKIQ